MMQCKVGVEGRGEISSLVCFGLGEVHRCEEERPAGRPGPKPLKLPPEAPRFSHPCVISRFHLSALNAGQPTWPGSADKRAQVPGVSKGGSN
jgi:hypothetical protein